MATVLDVGLLQKFDLIFPFLLVVVIVWGVLGYTKFLGDNKLAHGLVGVILGVMVLMSESIREIINSVAPWFVLLFLFIFFMMFLGKAGGLADTEMIETFSWLKITFVIISFIILIYVTVDVTVWNEDTETSADVVTGGDPGEGGESAFWATLRHPAVLGLIFYYSFY
jgi:hypothetical protein